jgi:hypothetical protein
MAAIQSSRLREVIQGIEFVEATEPATIVVTEQDIANGAHGDPFNCALAVAARRTWGPQARVAFLRTVAYVTWVDRNSRPRGERFTLPERTWRMIKVFDCGAMPEAGEYTLSPPAKSYTVKASYERARARRAKAQAEGRKITHAPSGPIDPLAFKRLQTFVGAMQSPPAAAGDSSVHEAA